MIPRSIALFLVAAAAHSQMSISGRVVDPAGVAVPMADVTIQPAETQRSAYAARTDNSGEFEVTALAPGSYEVRIVVSGFKLTTLPARVSSERPREDLRPIVLQLGTFCDGCGDSIESAAGWSIPRGCMFQLATRLVSCQLEIGHIEPVDPPKHAGPSVLFKSSGDLANLVPLNGAQIALDQPCQTASYSETPVAVDRPGLTTIVCLRSAVGNFQGTASPLLLRLLP